MLSLIDVFEEIDLFILEERGSGCNADDCLTFEGDFPTLNEATWSAVAGQTYYIVVDGFSKSEGRFELSLSCG